MAAEFVHLHVHSQYSLLDGALKIKDLVGKTKALGMRAVALTDHGNMFGAIQLYKACKDAQVGAILGCEVNVARPRTARNDVPSGKTDDTPVDHLVLLASNLEGYKSLVRIVSEGHVTPMSGAAPSVSLDFIAQNNKGLIGLSGCMGGVLAQRVLEEGEDEGRAAMGRLVEAFEPGSLYVELQDHGLVEQPVLNGILTRLAKDRGLPIVATNDAHFGSRDDGEGHLYLSCIAANRSYADAFAAHHQSFEMFLKSPDEMAHVFRDHPEAIKSTLEIAERCAGLKLKLGQPMLPTFALPEGFDTNSYFRHVSHEGLTKRFEEFGRGGKTVDQEAYRKRLDMELDVIIGMKFPGYFLIVWDFIRQAKEMGIPVGPGRGSGAGSLVAYALRITDLDPIPYNLLFERFLNPERVSMPDFDVDFCMDRRDEVIRYVAEKYGKDSVGQIATFHELKAKSVIKDVARAMSFPPAEAQKIANLIPQKGPGQTYTIPESIEIEPKLKAHMESDPSVRELLTQAQKLEGLTRHAGMHAAGIVISEGPLWDHVPCFRNGEALVTQYYKDDVEQAGLVKFDFLGLKTLTVIDIAVRLIHARPDQKGKAGAEVFDINAISLDDEETFHLLQSGETTGVFQLESSGMQQLFKDLRPTNFEDIVAAVALYRPGPLGTGMVKDFVDCKHGRKPIAKMHDLVDDLLKPTYGVIVYQEQVMQIAQQLAGYTLGGADLLRRAMGKKKPEEMAKQKSIFVEGSLKKGVSAEDADRIFGLLEFFAGYGFNKSHSAAYALITYQTAYLKRHYPVEFLCALMTADRDKIEKVVRIIAEGRAWGVDILPPDINESNIDFSVVYSEPGKATKKVGRKAPSKIKDADPYDPKIRFGLGAIRGVGESALEAVLEVRTSGGAFADLFDFAQRVDARRVNKGVLEALTQSGAFDATLVPRGITRARAFAALDQALERARSASKDRERGQGSLFSLFAKAAPTTEQKLDEYPQCEPWDLREMLVREKQSLGFYVSGHPLDRYGTELSRFEVIAASALPHKDPWSKVRVAGMVEGYRERIFKGGGGKVAFFHLEDTSGRVEVKVRDKQIEAYGTLLQGNEPVLVSGKVSFPQVEEGAEDEQAAPREPTLMLDEVVLLADAIRAETKSVRIRVQARKATRDHIGKLRDVLASSRGVCPVHLLIQLDDGAEAVLALGRDLTVTPSDEMLARLEKLFGEKVAELR
ncbi:DNA polymerase III subunit alpha [Polyangium jinanense]|uniref:DNA polymerase III subunit alpha n=1 Tax=Polyangium jinanense TaxID=2829994 RepID=A0A9X3X3B4_9BACT|nr:DNA polymerase III subunit alpha [Polyangium jinanense]MDC3957919.1 DNA polymerase III subunit alpha [Polyangium jinanense]MDC3961982.1 DNA polymerase III subunit alpha [Polyangium jinanense]MDC3983472.1 DNA polymerase III subunit alpha [Polyangium jinanense]